jgi:nucleotide-binding universal stress UspA family protein
MTPATILASSQEITSEFQLNSILLPTDFSDASDRAAYLARGLAHRFHAKLFLVHAVWQKDYEWDDALFQLAPGEDQGRRLTGEFVVNHQLEGLPHEIVVLSGSPADVVRKIAAEKNVDLIVLGANGLKGQAKLLFGTYSEHIYRNTTCPVLTIGPHVSPAKCTGTFHSIVFAINPYSAAAADALRYAIALTRTCNAYLTVANILPESQGLHGETLYRSEEEKRAQISRMLTENQLPLPHQPEIIVETGNLSDEIIKIAVGCGADLIVKGLRPVDAHSPNGHTYPISVNAHCPVLTVGCRTQPSAPG